MAFRSSARWLAPLALAGALLAIIVVLGNAGSGSPSKTTPTTTAPAARHQQPRRRVYVVKQGDALSVIAARTGVPLARLRTLNPGIRPQFLQRGQRIKLR